MSDTLPQDPPERLILTVEEVARAVGVSLDSFRRHMMNNPALRSLFTKRGRSLFARVADLDIIRSHVPQTRS